MSEERVGGAARCGVNCTSWRSGWMTMRGERLRLRHHEGRTEAVIRVAGSAVGAVGACADGDWLPSGDDAGLSASAAAGAIRLRTQRKGHRRSPR